jgi:hypothetical protein
MIHWLVINVFQNQEFGCFVHRLIVLLGIIVNVIYSIHWIIDYWNLQVYDNVQQIVKIQIEFDYIVNDKRHIQYVILLLNVDEWIIHQWLPYELSQEARKKMIQFINFSQ